MYDALARAPRRRFHGLPLRCADRHATSPRSSRSRCGAPNYKDGPSSHLTETETRQLDKDLRELVPKCVDDFLRVGRWYATHFRLEYRLKVGTSIPESCRSDPVDFPEAVQGVPGRRVPPRRGPRHVASSRAPREPGYEKVWSVLLGRGHRQPGAQEAILRCSGSCRVLDSTTQDALSRASHGGCWPVGGRSPSSLAFPSGTTVSFGRPWDRTFARPRTVCWGSRPAGKRSK